MFASRSLRTAFPRFIRSFSASSDHIAFVGLGNMGLPMAKNLVNAGKKVTAYDRDTAPVKELEDMGATAAGESDANPVDAISLLM